MLLTVEMAIACCSVWRSALDASKLARSSAACCVSTDRLPRSSLLLACAEMDGKQISTIRMRLL